MTESIEQILNSLGALSEMCRIFYLRLIDQGFTANQALALTKSMVAAALNNTDNRSNDI